MSETGNGAAAPALALHRVTKRYPGTLALDSVSLSVNRGDIHALVGGNGSGKSTAVKILAGVEPADDGDVEIFGDHCPVGAHSASRARDAGLRFVHQQSSIFEDLTVAENLSLGRGFEHGPSGRIRWSQVRDRSDQVLKRFGIDVDPDTEMRSVGPASQMMVAIARALQDSEGAHDHILVLDEPTASLPKHEVKTLLDALRRYAADGQTVVLVTHRLHEVIEVSDAATVLRDGNVAATMAASELTHDGLVRAITGRALALETEIAREKAGASTVQSSGTVTARGIGRSKASLTIRGGEVTAIAGLLGSGRSGILRALFGLEPSEDQVIEIDGRPVRIDSPGRAVQGGIAYVSEDRSDAMFPDESIARNISVTVLDEYSHLGWFDGRAERAKARDLIKTFDVRTASEESVISSLSGGNAQKVILARWMQREPRLLLLDEPTQGVDVGARAEIHGFLRDVASRGAAVLVVSSDFEELEFLADRVLIVRNGRVTGEITGDDIRADRIDSLVYAEGGSE